MSFRALTKSGLRTLWQHKRTSSAHILTLGLGLGLAVAAMSAAKAILLNPLPLPRPEQIVTLWRVPQQEWNSLGVTSLPAVEDWKRLALSFSGIAAFTGRTYTLQTEGSTLQVAGLSSASDLFTILGVQPRLGRAFMAGEDVAGSLQGSNPAIISDRLWSATFGGSESALGKRFLLDGRSYTVVGVMPAGFSFPVGDDVEVWTTLAEFNDSGGGVPLSQRRAVLRFMALGRLRPGVTVSAAQQEMARLSSHLRDLYPEHNAGATIRVMTAIDWIAGFQYRRIIVLFVGGVFALLLISAVNAITLDASRNIARRSQVAVRIALGANRRALLAEAFSESILLVTFSTALGAILGRVFLSLLIRIVPEKVPRLETAGLDLSVFAVAALLALLTAAASSFVVVGNWTRIEPAAVLREDGTRETSGAAGRRRVFGVAIVLQVALSVVLVNTAALLAKTSSVLLEKPLGFDPSGAITFQVKLPPGKRPIPARLQFFQTLHERLQAAPELSSVAAASVLPLTGPIPNIGIPPPADSALSQSLTTRVYVVEPGYFAAMGIGLVGRDFSPKDDAAGEPVVIVNQSLAVKLYSSADPTGRVIHPTINSATGDYKDRKIIGIAGDTASNDLRQGSTNEIYVPQGQVGAPSLAFAVRTPMRLQDAVSLVRARVRELDAAIPVVAFRPYEEYVQRATALPRFNSAAIALFALVGLLQSAMAINALAARIVLDRRREVAIRMALGASRNHARWLVVKTCMTPVMIGAVLGLAAYRASRSLVQGLLFGVEASNRLTVLLAVATVALTAFLVCYRSAAKMGRVHPSDLLR